MKRPIARLSTRTLVLAIVIFALFLQSVVQPTRADVIETVGSAIIGSPECEVIVGILTLGIASSICPQEHSVRPAPAPPEPMRCTPAWFAGPPTFFTKQIMTVKYIFHGSCSRADMPNAPALNYRLEGSWTPGVTNPNQQNASEALELTGYEPYIPDRAPGGRIFMYWTARCDREPWLSPEGEKYENCRDRRFYLPDDLVGKVTDLQPLGNFGFLIFPRSRNAIPAGDRQQLYARYLQLTSPATKVNPRVKARERAATGANPLVKAPSPPPPMVELPRQNAPITQPFPIPQPAPLPPSSVMQAPTPSSSAPAKMNQSPFMVRPRGVEKSPTPHSEPRSAP